MNNSELGPFDWDLVHMIKNLTNNTPHIAQSNKYHPDGYAIYWELDLKTENFQKIHIAILESIKGRAGERYIKTDPGKKNITYIKYDQNFWPTEVRYDLSEIDKSFGIRYKREVEARKYVRYLVQFLVSFVGGGTHTIPKTDAPSFFEFPNQDGLMLKVFEGDYVVLENGCFRVEKANEFEKYYK